MEEITNSFRVFYKTGIKRNLVLTKVLLIYFFVVVNYPWKGKIKQINKFIAFKVKVTFDSVNI